MKEKVIAIVHPISHNLKTSKVCTRTNSYCLLPLLLLLLPSHFERYALIFVATIKFGIVAIQQFLVVPTKQLTFSLSLLIALSFLKLI